MLHRIQFSPSTRQGALIFFFVVALLATFAATARYYLEEVFCFGHDHSIVRASGLDASQFSRGGLRLGLKAKSLETVFYMIFFIVPFCILTLRMFMHTSAVGHPRCPHSVFPSAHQTVRPAGRSMYRLTSERQMQQERAMLLQHFRKRPAEVSQSRMCC